MDHIVNKFSLSHFLFLSVFTNMTKNCKTCKTPIYARDRCCSCVSCNAQMNLEGTCTGLTNTAINGIKDLGLNALLLCDTCVTNNERENFIKCRTMMQINEKIEKESEGIQARLEHMEKKLMALVDEKVENAAKTTCEKLEKKLCRCTQCETC